MVLTGPVIRRRLALCMAIFFGLFAVLILVQLATTGAAAFRIYNKQRKG